ncbi:ring-exported protein 2 [Plasmodium gaboni]|uniref:Ring-exported protein 2 n=1 Tax=Plasmodium gaboni TaxID=647221 RepID=A0A151L3G6_9APIC|nr:ring-exported protein 2 [Plasmodium gaboni]KYN93518.1 ring-exported protein 2 [Plasmodium gaboni]
MNLSDIFSTGKESLLSLKDTFGSSNFSPFTPCEGFECLPQVLFLYLIFLLLCTGMFIHNKNQLKKKQRLTNFNNQYDVNYSGCAEQYDAEEQPEYGHEESEKDGYNPNAHNEYPQHNHSQNHAYKSNVKNQKVHVGQASYQKSAVFNE